MVPNVYLSLVWRLPFYECQRKFGRSKYQRYFIYFVECSDFEMSVLTFLLAEICDVEGGMSG